MIRRCYRSTRIAAIAVTLMGLASSAPAAVVEITYSGIVTTGINPEGLFGSKYDLDNDPFSGTFIFDTDIGHVVSVPGFNSVEGGSETSYASPSISTILTVNGISAPAYVGSIHAFALAYEFGAGQEAQTVDLSKSSDDFMAASIVNYVGSLPSTIDEPFTYTVQPGDTTNFLAVLGNTTDFEAGVAGNITSVTETLVGSPPPSPMPEPSTWFFMFIGIFGTGSVMRIRKNNARA
jgi:hypothetical protein